MTIPEHLKINFTDEEGLQYELDFDPSGGIFFVRLIISLGSTSAVCWRALVNGKIMWCGNERIVGKDATMSDEAKEYFDKAMKLLAFA